MKTLPFIASLALLISLPSAVVRAEDGDNEKGKNKKHRDKDEERGQKGQDHANRKDDHRDNRGDNGNHGDNDRKARVVVVHDNYRQPSRRDRRDERPVVQVIERRDSSRYDRQSSSTRYVTQDYRHFDYRDVNRDVSYRSRYPQQVVVYENRPYHYNYYDLQVVLAREGYYDGDVDGIWGPQSRSSLRRYQVDQGWRNDDQVDGRLIVNFNLGY